MEAVLANAVGTMAAGVDDEDEDELETARTVAVDERV